MSSHSRPGGEPGLFDDLPLHQDTSPPKPPSKTTVSATSQPAQRQAAAAPEPLPLFSEETEPSSVDFDAAGTRPAWRPVVPFVAQVRAGLIDLIAVLGVMLTVWLGLWLLDVNVDLVGRALVLVFLLPFSFLYQIFPLAFWGCTPGMARVGIVARNRDGQSLSFSQSARRWIASVLTVASAGLLWILTATTGQSLADRLSGSQTLPAK